MTGIHSPTESPFHQGERQVQERLGVRDKIEPFARRVVRDHMPDEHREFYGPTIMITPQDANEFKANYLDNVPTYDWKDFWGPSNGQIMYR